LLPDQSGFILIGVIDWGERTVSGNSYMISNVDAVPCIENAARINGNGIAYNKISRTSSWLDLNKAIDGGVRTNNNPRIADRFFNVRQRGDEGAFGKINRHRSHSLLISGTDIMNRLPNFSLSECPRVTLGSTLPLGAINGSQRRWLDYRIDTMNYDYLFLQHHAQFVNRDLRQASLRFGFSMMSTLSAATSFKSCLPT
jgi:hypothetical protein